MPRSWHLTLAWALCLGSCGQAWSGSFSVTPVRIFMAPRDRAVAVTLTNESSNPLRLQAELMAWQQDAQGQERLEITEDLILSPPLIELGPQGRQVVRLARLVPHDPEKQQSYRLIVREIPETPQTPASALQIPVTLALSMPIFITPPGVRHRLQCALEVAAPARAQLSCHNTGTAHAQVQEVTVSREGQVLGRYNGSTYVLPGARQNLPLTFARGAPASGPLTVRWVLSDAQRDQLETTWP